MPSKRVATMAGITIPTFLYGTAWKEDATQACVRSALESGFRGIDTANQRIHYHEAAVGDALKAAYREGVVAREDLFLQTKYTLRRGQDHRLPYDPDAPPGEQVRQSFASSLQHLGADWIDSLILHGPSKPDGLTPQDREIWEAMEGLHGGGGVRYLGLSNVNRDQLDQFWHGARIKPKFVQNRCFAATRWDSAVRDTCGALGVTYQGFSLLTANAGVLRHPRLVGIARRHGRTPAQIVFRFAIDAGMVPLTGTTDPRHMQEDLEVEGFRLEPPEMEEIENISG